jgi:cell division protein FtsB
MKKYLLPFLLSTSFLFSGFLSWSQNMDEHNIKNLISELTYARMEFWKNENGNLTQLEKEGMNIFREKYKGKDVWNPDSIEVLLNRYDWDSCNKQVFTPLSKTLKNDKLELAAYMDLDVGSVFMNSDHYNDVWKIFEDQNDSGIDHTTQSENRNTTTTYKDITEQNTYLDNPNLHGRKRSLIFTIFLILIILGALLVLGSYFYIKSRRSKRGRKTSHSNYSLRDQDNKKIYQEIHKLEERIRKLESDKEIDTKNSINITEKTSGFTDDPIEQKIEDAPQPISDSIIKTEYHDSHVNGRFRRDFSRSNAGDRTVFSIKYTDKEGTLSLNPGRRVKELINDRDLLLEPTCEINFADGSRNEKIRVLQDGKVRLENDTWRVDEKVKIEIY